MNKIRFSLTGLAVVSFFLAVCSSGQAATRTWVSGVGDDLNPCSRTAPCKTYAGAITKTDKDGEISTLDPGGYGTVTITKSITINGGGTGQGYGSILSSSTTGVIINITSATDLRKTVRLNWLDINGAPSSAPGLTGIRGLSFSALQIENTVIDSFRSSSAGFGHGIHVNNSLSGNVTLRNVVIRNCLNSGVRVEASGSGVTNVAAHNLQVTNCATGFDAANGTRASIRDSLISHNATGVALSEAASGTVVNIDHTTISTNSGTGINVVGGSRARIAFCVITQNGTSLAPAASVDTGNNNTVMGNTTNTLPAGTPFPPS